MASSKIESGDIQALARAVEASPLSPDITEYLDSLNLDLEERQAVVEFMNGMRFGGDGVKALPQNPPQITSQSWV